MSDTKGFNPEYDDNKLSNTIYFSKATKKSDGSSYRKVELLLDKEKSYLSEKNKEAGSTPVEFSIRDTVTLYETRGGQEKIHCWLIESMAGKQVEAIHICRRTGKGVYGAQEVTLSFEAIHALRQFINNLTWLNPYKTTYTNAGTAVSAVEFVKIKNQVARLEQMIEVLQKVECTFSAPLRDKLRALEELHGEYSVHVLCDALQVSRGTFYNHILRNKKENKSYQLRRAQLSEEIKQVFEESNQIYGAKKITAVLRERGTITSDKMVSELMQEMNIYSIRLGAKKNYMQFNYEKKIDSLKMDFTVTAPNQVWVSDVTFFKLKSKMYYICVILDLYSRKAIACRISQKHSTRFITTIFRQAYEARCPGEGLIFHSDRGTQYTAHAFQKLLKTCSVTQSFSPSGKPHHNAVMESFFASMKREELYRTNYHSVAEFMRRIESYIEFYNVKRPHATLSYKTPETHERLFYSRNPAKAV